MGNKYYNSDATYSSAGVSGILKVCIPTVPALFIAGLAPFRAHSLFPPKGTYCWDEGRLSVLRSCLLCLSRRMECTAFRKSFLWSGELKTGKTNKKKVRAQAHKRYIIPASMWQSKINQHQYWKKMWIALPVFPCHSSIKFSNQSL